MTDNTDETSTAIVIDNPVLIARLEKLGRRYGLTAEQVGQILIDSPMFMDELNKYVNEQ